MGLEIRLIPCLTDNYAYLARDVATGAVAVVDPPEAGPVKQDLASTGWHLSQVINTHHHMDHIGGNYDLAAVDGLPVAGPGYDAARIPTQTIALRDGDAYSLGATRFEVIFVPGHTSGHIAFHSADAGVLFCGDTLFSLGCGRLFEGTPEQMWHSLKRLRALPDETQVCCAHEYTQNNCRFALTVDPDNPALAARANEINELRAIGKPTVPSTIGLEKATNPFLRADELSLQRSIGMSGSDPVAVFAEIRRRKDNF